MCVNVFFSVACSDRAAKELSLESQVVRDVVIPLLLAVPVSAIDNG